MKKRIYTVLLTVAMVLSLIGCGEEEVDITGKWTPEDNAALDEVESTFPLNFELFSDGTGSGEGMSLTWIAENKRIKFDIEYVGMTFNYTYDYELTESKLILIDSDTKESVTYVKD